MMVNLEEMPTNSKSQGGRAGRCIQEHGRLDNPSKDSGGSATTPWLFLSSLDQSQSPKDQKLSLAQSKGSHHTAAHLNELLPVHTNCLLAA